MTAGTKTVRVALLICGYWTHNLLEYNGDYLRTYARWLNASLPPNSGYKLVMEAYDVIKDDYPEDDIIDDYDVVMITGSRKCSPVKFPAEKSSIITHNLFFL